MEFGPIFSSMRKNRVGVILIAMQIAVTFAVVLNCLTLAQEHLKLLNQPNGYDVDNMMIVRVEHFDKSLDDPQYEKDIIDKDLRWLRGQESIIGAMVIHSYPLSGSGSSTGYFPEGQPERRSSFGNNIADGTVLETFGVELAEGRVFTAAEVEQSHYDDNSRNEPTVAMVTQELADALYPDGDAIGKVLHNRDGPGPRIIGIIKHMHGFWRFWSQYGRNALFPGKTARGHGQILYMVRVQPGSRDATMTFIEENILVNHKSRLVKIRSLEEVKLIHYQSSFATSRIMVGISIILIIVTALGIAGLTSFWVNRRTKHIGIRRALGARQSDILRYFLLENTLITVIGLGVGLGLAYLLNWQLMLRGESVMQPLPFLYLLIGMVSLWLLGLVSVFVPARRAARINPAIATRT